MSRRAKPTRRLELLASLRSPPPASYDARPKNRTQRRMFEKAQRRAQAGAKGPRNEGA